MTPRWRTTQSLVPRVVLLLFSLSMSVCSPRALASWCDWRDREALLEFKNAFNDPGGIFATWNSSTDCCSWRGVNCTESGRVQALTVQAPAPQRGQPPVRNPNYNGIVGGSLGSLEKLDSLVLTNVFFNGPAPASLGQLSLLTFLDLGGDNFSGSIPPAYGGMTNLVSIRLSSGFHGPIPSSLCNLVNIVDFDLSQNFLTGGIPSCVYRWKRISSLGLDANLLSGPITPVLGALNTLTVLSLGNNLFTGPIPKTLRRLSNLELLLLSENRLSGYIPSELSQLKKLRSLDLDQNRLRGKIPRELGSLPELEFLALYGNKLVGGIPRELAKLPKIATLQVLSNRLTGCLPKEFGNVPASNQLNLDVSNNYLSCPLPDNLNNLNSFIANHNFFSGSFPLSLMAASVVVVSNNRLTSLSPKSTAANLPPNVSILNLDLSSNHFTEPLPGWFSSLSTLQFFDISSNEIKGELPVSLLELPNLIQVNISRNQLNKQLPSQPFTSPVGTLDASKNQLYGPISEAFVAGLNALFFLDLSDNKLNGVVPADIVKPGLQYLNLSGNSFTGPVPSIP